MSRATLLLTIDLLPSDSEQRLFVRILLAQFISEIIPSKYGSNIAFASLFTIVHVAVPFMVQLYYIENHQTFLVALLLLLVK